MNASKSNSAFVVGQDTSHWPAIDPYRLSLSMLWLDRFFLLPLYLLLLLPVLIEFQFQQNSLQHVIALKVINRVLELALLYWVSLRWISRVKNTLIENRPAVFMRLVSWGFAIWLLATAPVWAIRWADDTAIRFLALVICAPAIYLALKYYFYFFPLAAGQKNLPLVLQISLCFHKTDRLLALKAMTAPAALTFLVAQLALLPAPDGRYLLTAWLLIGSSGIFWTLATYLSLAYCFALLSEEHWQQLAFDQKLRRRLETIALEDYGNLHRIVTPANGLYIFLLAVLLFLANNARLLTMPPAARIQVSQLEVFELDPAASPVKTAAVLSQVQAKLIVSDQEFHLRGFSPYGFMLGGEKLIKNSVLSPSPSSVQVKTLDGNTIDILTGLPKNLSHIELLLQFNTDRGTDSLRKITDLYLWYRGSRIEKLDIEKAPISASKAAVPQD